MKTIKIYHAIKTKARDYSKDDFGVETRLLLRNIFTKIIHG